MKSLQNIKLGPRLALAFGMVLLLMLVIAVVGLRGIGSVSDALRNVYIDRTIPLQQLGDVNRIINRNRVLVMDIMARPTKENIERRSAELSSNVQAANELWKAYMASAMTPEEASLAAEFAKAREAYVKQGLLAVRDAIVAGQDEEAVKIYTESVSKLGPPAEKAINELVKLQVAQAAKEYEAAQSTRATATAVAIGVALIALFSGAFLAWVIVKSITRPIGEAVALAKAISAGDLTSQVHAQGRDEVAELLRELAEMNASLVRIVGQVRNSSDSIATGSAQIASGNADLSQRTEEQASNLQQTAASMEQLTATVKQNADTARQATQLAGGASSAASQGGRVVEQVVVTMGEITESSRRIADIIGTIDGIAFQTNILALNAAVEAARAGEQGRGFAVVASEVRSLAQRSAQAAKEIKTLIGASVEKVENGSRLVHEAGQSMGEIVSQVRRVNDLINEISAASVEQSSGISQVGDAVNQLDQVTQQNAALVEESAAAAESLKHQAANLAKIVAVFKLS
ncbi:methyl-accepting chemotaxis protein [Roseateles toxinivorans]|uniref:Methyl-accepting chemotaxis protein-1 (Serine sensor receptor) n=1 Tax=Roseateles toxinivorans TaxID=270368 RepID=A0A4R6QRP3_9BURK|nr:methyl-accepting chemotaxis protein [Roseateles toxinivorans]TDP72895.1 methyl-accepting chemotaxis protein-1 (serine sensor receptor) [Roseateles toxinivorans]